MSPKAHKVTKRNLIKKQVIAEKENQNKSEKEIEELVNHRVAIEFAHPRKERAKYFGELIEMDASQYFWYGPKKIHLHLAIDN